jgi:hypothetical protein
MFKVLLAKKMIKKNYIRQSGCGVTADGGESLALLYVRDLNDRADRIKRLKFHIERGDYFSVLATIINIALKEPDFDKEKIFSKLYEDLQYLQENYIIAPKSRR